MEFLDEEQLLQVVEAIQDDKTSLKKSTIDKIRQEFLNKCHRNLITKCQPKSLDEINLGLMKYHPYFFHKNKKYQCHPTLKVYHHYFYIIDKLATCFLSHRDGEMVYKYWENDMDKSFLGPFTDLEKVYIFNILSRLIPLDILVASYYAKNGISNTTYLNGFYHHINLADAPLHGVLMSGVAENHLHVSTALNFAMLWERAMNTGSLETMFKCFTPSYTVSSLYNVVDYLKVAQILRFILANYSISNRSSSIEKWLGSYGFNISYIDFVFSLQNEEKKNMSLSRNELSMDNLKQEFGITDGDREEDIIFSIIKGDSKCLHTYGENLFLHKMYEVKQSLEDTEKSKEIEKYKCFCKFFFMYIRIKNDFYQQVTQASTLKGLDFFRPFFTRASRGYKNDVKGTQYYKSLLRSLFQDQYLKKVELRLGMRENAESNRKLIKTILTSYKEIIDEDYRIGQNSYSSLPRIGLVYHLIKEKDHINKCWCTCDNKKDKSKNDSFISYKKIQKTYIKQVKAILELRNDVPYLSNFIVGLDAASLENNTPVEVFAPVYQMARDSSTDNFFLIDRDGRVAKNQSLFFTFHAGEDFRHILTGLRRMDEVIDFLKFHSGDRIGHGIALGINIEKWSSLNPVVILPRGEYLDNLLWVWGVYTKSYEVDARATIYLEQKIYEVSKKIFNCANGLTPAVLFDTYKMRFKEFEIEESFKPKQPSAKLECKEDTKIIERLCPHAANSYNRFWDSNKLNHAYHCKCYLEKLNEPIYVDTSGVEKDIAIDIQRYLIEKIAQKGIVIEVNPTSNNAIGEINSLFDNQLFQINKPQNESMNNVLTSINSDNPIVFNTNVSNEIGYIYYGMLNKGISKELALQWVDKVRKTGMETSFIRSNTTDEEYIRHLDTLLKALDTPNI